jgi:hypothetical protein
MKRIMVIGLMLLAVAVGAQDLRSNNQALLFSFGGLSNMALGDFDAGPIAGIGAKLYNAAGTMAVRPAILFGMNSSETDLHTEDVVNPKEKTTSFGVMVDLIKPLVKSNLAPFVGVGGGYYSQKYHYDAAHESGEEVGVEDASKSGFSIRGIVGVEWFFKKNVSVSGEYRLSFTKGSSEAKAKDAGEDEWDYINYLDGFPNGKGTFIGVGASGLITVAFYIR